jgi:hypothetical protein
MLWTVSAPAPAQTTISGLILDEGGSGISGASVYLANTLDGTSSGASGKFSLNTSEMGERSLVISAVGYATQERLLVLNGTPHQLTITLLEESAQLNEVVISAGAFEATNDREVALLRPVDIYSNAGAAGDIVGAIQTLPGTQRVAEQTGLFVRGGDASESAVIIDGMVVQNAFFSQVPGVAQRSRFTPFQFKGMAFSSGGYSVRYGQALSSVLELNTPDLPEKSTVSANINMAGVSVSGAKRWERSAAEVMANYSNLSPFYSLANTNFDFYDVPKGAGASARWSVQNKGGGIFKAFVKHDRYQSGTAIPNPYDASNNIRFGLNNENTYFNASFRQLVGKTLWYSSIAASDNKDGMQWGDYPSQGKDWRVQWRGEASYFAADEITFTLGSELQRFGYRQDYDTLLYTFDEYIPAAYFEVEWKPGKRFAVKPGVRLEYSRLLNRSSAAPRLAMALKTGEYSQVSVAGGLFYQLPDKRYLLPGYRTDLQRAVHYIVNYQRIAEARSFRVEAYYKSYASLVRELNAVYTPNTYRLVYGNVDNSGDGYAQGVDVFWRDQKTISNFDYWISYSYVKTERLYANLAEKATPDFVSTHNANVTAKYMVEPLQINLSVTYSYSSGRPYYNPSDSRFLGSHGPDYHNVAFHASYLTTLGKWFTVFYAGIDNVLNRKNVLGYRYAADAQQRYAVVPPLYRSVFFGANISLTAFKKDEL